MMKGALFPVRLPLSAAVQVPSFEYPSLLPEPPSSLPAWPLPARQNMNALVSHKEKLVKVPFTEDTPNEPKGTSNTRKGTASMKHQSHGTNPESSHRFPVGEKKHRKMCTRVELMSSQMWLAKPMRAQLGFTSWNLYNQSSVAA